jgi:hypothetical protein
VNPGSWSANPAVVQSEAALPPWLEGRWRVSSSLDGVDFPLGRKFISDSLPGVRMVSVLALPNIGSTPTYEVTLAGDVGAQRGANAQATLEAFWPSATVLDVSAPRTGQLRLTYESPTRSKARVKQSVELQTCASEGGPLDDDGWLVSEVFQQDNVEQGTRGEYLRFTQCPHSPPYFTVLVHSSHCGVCTACGAGEYLVLTAYARDGAGVRARQRVAAFLQPTDGQYLDALGKPVALYDYR